MKNQQLKLRKTEPADLEYFFRFQLDEEAAYLAAFMAKDYADKEKYIAKYAKFLRDPTIHMQTILADGVIVGSIAKFMVEAHAEITYWIDRQYWGNGIATAALRSFLAVENSRPIFGRVAFDNAGSRKVLENCGFVRIGADRGFANARQAEIEEFIYELR